MHRHGGRNAVVHVVIERDGVRAEARRDAVGEEGVILRRAAEATIEALESLLGGTPRFALVGAKRMLAFDSAILLACVRTIEGPTVKLLGCVPDQDDDPITSVGRAVLHATNRIVEALPNGPESEEDGPAFEAH